MQKCCVWCFFTFCKNAFVTFDFALRTFCWCKNAFDAKMHFGCAKMHFCITFFKGKCSAKQNVTNAFVTFYWCKKTFLQSKMYATQSQMFSCAKMHLMLCKNIFLHHILLVLNIFQRKM